MKICVNCCWYDDDADICKKQPDNNDENGKVGDVVECSSFVEFENEGCFTTWVDFFDMEV